MSEKFTEQNENIEKKDMGQELTHLVQEKAAQPSNDRRNLMQNVYDANMQSVKDGLENDVMGNGTLDEKRDFMKNVMSANLYGKQLATKDNPVTVPDIEVDDKTGAISLTLQDYTPPEISYEIGSAKDMKNSMALNDMKNRMALNDTMSVDERDVRTSMRKVNAYVDSKQDTSTPYTKSDGFSGTINKVKESVEKVSVKEAGITGARVGATVGSALGGIGVGTGIGAGIGGAIGVAGSNVVNALKGSEKKNVVESRRNSIDKTVSDVIKADKKSSRIAQAEALSSNIKSDEKSSEAEFV